MGAGPSKTDILLIINNRHIVEFKEGVAGSPLPFYAGFAE